MYAHMIKGPLLVRPGDKVKRGEVIGKLGNTGDSSGSHMHFQLMNGPSLLGADSLPYVIDTFNYDGQVATATGADSGGVRSATRPSPAGRLRQVPGGCRWYRRRAFVG